MQLNGSDILVLAGCAGTVAGAAAGITWFVSEQFRQTRAVLYQMMEKMNTRVTRLEMHLVRRDGYQPAIDPLDFNGRGDPSH